MTRNLGGDVARDRAHACVLARLRRRRRRRDRAPRTKASPRSSDAPTARSARARSYRVCFPADLERRPGHLRPRLRPARRAAGHSGRPVRRHPVDEVINASGTPTPPRAIAPTAWWRTWRWRTWRDLEDEVRRTVRPDPTRVYSSACPRADWWRPWRQSGKASGTPALSPPAARSATSSGRSTTSTMSAWSSTTSSPACIPGQRHRVRRRRSARGWTATYAPAVIAALGGRSRRGAGARRRHRRSDDGRGCRRRSRQRS